MGVVDSKTLRGRMDAYRYALESSTPCESNGYLYAGIRPLRVRGSLSKVRQSFNFGRFRFVSESTESQKQHMNRKLEEKSFSVVVLVSL